MNGKVLKKFNLLLRIFIAVNKLKRNFSPREKNHLLKHGFSIDANLNQYKDMPVEYITGFAEFMNTDFIVNDSVLIPRLETEELVKLSAQKIKKYENKHICIADVGTGSGNIGICLYKLLKPYFDIIEMYLIDVSSSALKIAQQNYNKILVETKHKRTKDKFYFIESDLLSDIQSDIKFDAMIANLPYIPQEDIQNMPNEVAAYEPNLAFDGGQQGLILVNKFLEQAPAFMHSNSNIFMELDITHYKHNALALDNYNYKFLFDEFSRFRFLILDKKCYN